MPQTTYDRWQSAWPKTWPGYVFKKHHTELNDLYWAGTAGTRFASITTRTLPATDMTTTALHVSGKNARRMNFDMQTWRKLSSEHGNWSRLSALMSLQAYLETFFASISWLALASNPGLLLASSRAVDGIALVKANTLPDFSEHISGLTKGEWSVRLANYKRLFGLVPSELTTAIGELEQMRKLRNGVGHAFGRLIEDYRDATMVLPTALQRLSEERLQRWLALVDDCVSRVENHLRTEHVGGFEILLKYHRWDKRYPAGHMREETAFKASIGATQGNAPPSAYFRSAIAYYRRA